MIFYSTFGTVIRETIENFCRPSTRPDRAHAFRGKIYIYFFTRDVVVKNVRRVRLKSKVRAQVRRRRRFRPTGRGSSVVMAVTRVLFYNRHRGPSDSVPTREYVTNISDSVVPRPYAVCPGR